MENIKYKEAEAPGWYYSFDENGNKSQSWSEKNRPVMYKEMREWEAKGNTIEPQYTAEEQAVKDQAEVEAAAIAYKGERAAAYAAAGLTFDSWTELVIEKNTAGQTAFRAERDAIKAAIPKPS